MSLLRALLPAALVLLGLGLARGEVVFEELTGTRHYETRPEGGVNALAYTGEPRLGPCMEQLPSTLAQLHRPCNPRAVRSAPPQTGQRPSLGWFSFGWSSLCWLPVLLLVQATARCSSSCASASARWGSLAGCRARSRAGSSHPSSARASG